MTRKLLVTALAFGVSTVMGCASTWHRPNTTEAEFYADRLDCEQQATHLYPVAIMPVGVGHQAPAQTYCNTFGNQTTCTTQPGNYTPPPQVDVNVFKRGQAVDMCLRSKGYVR